MNRTILFSILCGLASLGVEGNVHKNYCHSSGLSHSSIRKCCIQHLNCPILLEKESTKYGLSNTLPYHVYYCKCERSFYNCLSQVNTGRSVSTRRAHFLEDVSSEAPPPEPRGNGRTPPASLRKCLNLEETRICTRKLFGLVCVQHEDTLQGTLTNFDDFL